MQRPGSAGTTWRLHAQWNLGTGRWEELALTDAHGAESWTRLRLRPADVVLADRHDAQPNALAWVVAHGAHGIVRVGGNAVRGETRDGTPWSVRDAARDLPVATPGDWAVQIPGTATRPTLPLRLVALRKAPPAAERARRQARQDARQPGHTATAATLEAADYVLVLTSLPAATADAAEILELYRLRWQIACAFKRLKSLRHLDALRAFDPDLAQTYLLAQWLGAVMVDALEAPDPDLFPYGFPVRPDVPRRLAEYSTDLARPPRHRARSGPSRRLATPAPRRDGRAP